MRGLAKLVLGIAAVVLGIFVMFGFAPGDVKVLAEAGLGVACAGGATLL